MSNNELITKCQKYQKLIEDIEKRELEKKKIQAELKKELERKKVDELEIGIYRFSNKLSKAKTLFDTKAFAEKHPKLFVQFTIEGKASTRFLFGLVKQ